MVKIEQLLFAVHISPWICMSQLKSISQSRQPCDPNFVETSPYTMINCSCGSRFYLWIGYQQDGSVLRMIDHIIVVSSAKPHNSARFTSFSFFIGSLTSPQCGNPNSSWTGCRHRAVHRCVSGRFRSTIALSSTVDKNLLTFVMLGISLFATSRPFWW